MFAVTLNSEMDLYLRNGRMDDFLYEMELQNSILFIISGLIKSDSPTPRATDFWGRASEKLPPARPRTSDFYGQSCPQLMSFKRVKINNWLLNTHRQVAWWHVYCVMSTASVIVN